MARLQFGCLIALLTLAGCATLKDSATQAVPFVSTPEGATILRAGVPVAQTPAYVEVSRNAPNEIALATRTGPRGLDLKRRYRWGASFWSNFIFLWAAPVGWAVDYFSGAAFEIETPPPAAIDLDPKDRQAYRARPTLYAIAPTRSDEPTLTDAAGDAIEAHQRRRGRRVLGYRQTLPVFNHHGYDFDGAPDPGRRSGLYLNLGADVIIESSLKPRGDRLMLETRERSVFKDQVTDGDRFEIEAPSGADRAFVSGRWWSRLLPNTLAIDLAPTRTTLSYDGTTYALVSPAHAGFLAQSLDYLSSIKITSLPARRFEAASHWALSLVPTIRASRRRFTVPDLDTTADEDRDTIYTRWLAGAGYGPEVGWQSGKHYLYLNALPMLLYSEVSTRKRQAGALGLQVSAELGYLYFVTKSWNVRLFSRSQTENDQIWRRVLGDRLTHGQSPVSVGNVLAGVSVGYRFEPRVRFKRGRGDK